MALCDRCITYMKSYDEFYRDFDDALEEAHEQPDMHFCMSYKNGIPKNISDGSGNCEYFIPKEE